MLLNDKYGNDMSDGYKLISSLANQTVSIYHLTKIAAKREIIAIYSQTQAVLEDHLFLSGVIDNCKGSFLPHCLPYLFLYLDSEVMIEEAMELLYTKPLV